MGTISLEFRCPMNVNGIAADPQPDWSFDALLLELNSLENRLKSSVNISSSFPKSQARGVSAVKKKNGNAGAFVMQFSDDDMDMESDQEEEDDHCHDRAIVVGKRFTCDELTVSDAEEFEGKSGIGTLSDLMDAVGFVEGTLFELRHDQHLSIMENIRSQVMELETDVTIENEKFISKLASVEKYAETKRGMEKNLDMQYQRKIAEALDNHLTAVQRDHEHKSQIEERRIRDDAVREEARRKEKAHQEEKLRQERIKAETERQARLEAERVEAAKAAAEEASQKAAAEASRKAAKEAAEREASELRRNALSGVAENSVTGLQRQSVSPEAKTTVAAGNLIRSAENALKMAEKRLKIFEEVAARNNALRLASNMLDYRKHEQKIARNIRQITGSKENVRAKAGALLNLIGDPSYPQSISIAMFAEKFVSLCENPSGTFNRSVYAYGQVIVLVTSKVPPAMDILIAELNRVCIYTVPKHVTYSKVAFEKADAYYKALGYREEDGKTESSDRYVERLSSYMKLYGALVQTEVPGVQNLHGITEGWAWLARFLNTLPPNLYTAVALQSFLEMAGFTLYRRYRNQFKKILRIIDRNFVSALGKQEDPKLSKTVANLRNYLDSNQFLQEPEGWQLESYIESNRV